MERQVGDVEGDDVEVGVAGDASEGAMDGRRWRWGRFPVGEARAKRANERGFELEKG